jgi:hypothetical protein
MLLRIVLPMVALFFLGACASGAEEARNVEALSDSGQCAAADAGANRLANQDFGAAAYLHAEIASNCRHDQAMTLGYLNLSARYGNEAAQLALTKMGRPVPPADLMEKAGTNCLVLAGGLIHCQ